MLPRSAKDASTHTSDLVVYIYNKEDKTWKKIGYAPDLKIVDEEKDGLVVPELFNKLTDIDLLKIKTIKLTDEKAYFYYFHSSDKYVLFKNYSNELLIEINKPAIYRKLTSIPCVGPPGDHGLIGDRGKDGRPAAKEKNLKIVNQTLEAFVSTPLNDQPISIRVLNDDNIVISEALYFYYEDKLEDDDGIIKSIQYKDGVLKATIPIFKKAKVRQRGSKGIIGTDGLNGLEIKPIDLADDVIYTTALLEIGLTNIGGNLLVKKGPITDIENCVFKFNAANIGTIGNYFVALEITTDDCKKIFYNLAKPDPQKPPLDLPNWTPTSGCVDYTRQCLANLNWDEGLDLPFELIKDTKAKEAGCKTPFWFCGNSGNSPCDGDIDINIKPQGGGFFGQSSSSSTSSDSSRSSTSEDTSSHSDSSTSLSSTSSSSISSKSTESSSSIGLVDNDSSLSSQSECCPDDFVVSIALTREGVLDGYSCDGTWGTNASTRITTDACDLSFPSINNPWGISVISSTALAATFQVPGGYKYCCYIGSQGNAVCDLPPCKCGEDPFTPGAQTSSVTFNPSSSSAPTDPHECAACSGCLVHNDFAHVLYDGVDCEFPDFAILETRTWDLCSSPNGTITLDFGSIGSPTGKIYVRMVRQCCT